MVWCSIVPQALIISTKNIVFDTNLKETSTKDSKRFPRYMFVPKTASLKDQERYTHLHLKCDLSISYYWCTLRK